MSTSLLYHAFSLRGYRYCKTNYIEGSVVFTITQDRKTYCCSNCGSGDVESRGQRMRVFQSLPIGGKRRLFIFRCRRFAAGHAERGAR